MAHWYYKTPKGVHGPVSAKELIGLRRDGKLRETDDVRKGSTGRWVKATRVKGLFDTSEQVPPVPPVYTDPVPPPPPIISDAVPVSQPVPPPPRHESTPIHQKPVVKRWGLLAMCAVGLGLMVPIVWLEVSAMIGSSASRTPQEVFAKVSPAVVCVVVRDDKFQIIGQGSGFFVSSDGTLVTNFHVIDEAHSASVLLENNTTFFVDGVAATDVDNDLALLQINGADLSFVTLGDTELPEVGARVYAIGSPKGLANTFSEGLVSGIRGEVIQTTAAISPGSSGGPLINAEGEVVGVTTSGLVGGQNLNFVVPTNHVIRLLANRGELVSLASAGTNPLDPHATDSLDKVWIAIYINDFRKALSLLTKLRADLQHSSLYWSAAGYLHSEMGNHELAIAAYKSAIAIKPDDADAYVNMGIALRRLERYTEAIAAYKSAIAIKPDYADAYYDMGIALQGLERYTEAIAAYKSAIAIKPDDADAYVNMGVALHHLERDTEAIDACKSAIAIEPDYANAYYNMGSSLQHLERYTEAIAAYKSAIAIKPDSVAANRAAYMLRKLDR